MQSMSDMPKNTEKCVVWHKLLGLTMSDFEEKMRQTTQVTA